MPTGKEFLYHWNVGVPPLNGVAVKVTDVPAQTGFADEAIETTTGIFGFTVMVRVPDVAGLPEAQRAVEVSTQVTASLFTE